MGYFNILRDPDAVIVYKEEGFSNLNKAKQEVWQSGNIEVATKNEVSQLKINVKSPAEPIRRIALRWNEKINAKLSLLGDHWERSYGDLEWRGIVPERVMPWYFLSNDGECTHGYGVKTGAKSMCYWQVDTSGVTLCMDVKCGGRGVQLGNRELEAAVVVARKGEIGETPFQAAREFCRKMCDKPLLPSYPVYGSNNWYYAYGKSSHNEILEDSKLISSLAPSSNNRPFMVIDDGWQVCHANGNNGGPWDRGNYLFPDMQKLASEMEQTGVRPGIWVRPLLTVEKVPEKWLLSNKRLKLSRNGQFLDPSIPEVLNHVADDIKRLVDWGYKLIKHDFSTFDIFGHWGFEMSTEITRSNWSFSDTSKTSAEIVLDLYETIRAAASDSIIIGCNTIGHLAAGLVHLQRTGDDTSGVEWERTRKMGINTLAFRMPQNGTFFAVDADCVGLTNDIDWAKNGQWLELLAQSGTPLFVSASPDAVGSEQEKALKAAFETASKSMPSGEPLDWMQTTCPAKWLLNGSAKTFKWF